MNSFAFHSIGGVRRESGRARWNKAFVRRFVYFWCCSALLLSFGVLFCTSFTSQHVKRTLNFFSSRLRRSRGFLSLAGRGMRKKRFLEPVLLACTSSFEMVFRVFFTWYMHFSICQKCQNFLRSRLRRSLGIFLLLSEDERKTRYSLVRSFHAKLCFCELQSSESNGSALLHKNFSSWRLMYPIFRWSSMHSRFNDLPTTGS